MSSAIGVTGIDDTFYVCLGGCLAATSRPTA